MPEQWVCSMAKPQEERWRFTCKAVIQRARSLVNLDYCGEMKGNVMDYSDPFAQIAVCDSDQQRRIITKSKTIYNSLDPVWNHKSPEFEIFSDEMLVVEIYDKDAGEEDDDELGVCLLPASAILQGGGLDGEYQLDLSMLPDNAKHGVESFVSFKVIIVGEPSLVEVVEDRRTYKSMQEIIAEGLLPTLEEMETKRNVYEGTEGEGNRIQLLRKQLGNQTKETEVERFLDMMRERGEGSITLAWRRYFDSDGDGSLSFCEFCEALTEFEYKNDVLKLWHALSDGASELGLEVLDAEGADILDSFARWCEETLGGPYEVFQCMDQDGSDSLEADEFVEGLEELGFFDATYLPEAINTPDAVLTNLYPLLDKRGHGCVTADQVLFLEKDKDKRTKIEKKLARIRNYGHDGAPEPLANDAQRLLNNAYMTMTPAGGKSFKMLKGDDAQLACGASEPLRSKFKTRMRQIKKQGSIMKRAESSPSMPNAYMAEAMQSFVDAGMTTPFTKSSAGKGGLKKGGAQSQGQLPQLKGVSHSSKNSLPSLAGGGGNNARRRLPAIDDRKLSKDY